LLRTLLSQAGACLIMDAGAVSFRFNFGDSGEAEPSGTVPQPAGGAEDAAAAVSAREEFPLLEVRRCHARAGVACRVLTLRRCVQPPGAAWRAEEVAIGADGFTLLKARRCLARLRLRCAPRRVVTLTSLPQADGTLVKAAAATLAGGVSATDLVPGRYEGTSTSLAPRVRSP
jgi:hypothetical protein